jgi:hypothetical protein
MFRLAYISAASHSGSTLLAMLLGSHPEVCTVGEIKANKLGDPERYRCSCGELIRKCSFWRNVSARMAERGFEYEVTRARTSIHGSEDRYIQRLLTPLHRGPILETCRDLALGLYPGWWHHLRVTQARNAALVRTLLEISGEKIVVDSSKIGLRLKYLLKNRDLDVRVIRCIRDGRGVALTYMDPSNFADARDPKLRVGGTGDERSGPRMSMTRAAREWRRSNEEAENVLAGLDRSRWIEVRYEQVCADPKAALRRLCEFLEINPERIVDNFRAVEQHVVGNGMRLDKTSEIRLDERWRTHLTPEQLQEFDRVAGDLNRKYGYQ